MPHPTDELIGHRMVFALAQIPKVHESGHRLASLAPLMDLDTGEIVQGNVKHFPSDGYVFWWSVPNVQLSPGDLVVGTLLKAGDKSYGSGDQSWYQVSPDASLCNGEVFEFVKTTIGEEASLRRLVDGRKVIDNLHEPPKHFFVWVDDQMVGPFHPQRFGHFSSPTGYCCSPTDLLTNKVRISKGGSLCDYVENEVGYCEVQLSSTTQHPAKAPRSRFIRRYRLIRKQDLATLSKWTHELTLPSDDFAITKACNLVEGRNSIGEAQSVLSAIVEKLRIDENLLEGGVAQAIQEISQRLTESDEAIEKIASLLTNSDAVSKRVSQVVDERAGLMIISKTNEIWAEAEKLSEEVLVKLHQVDEKLESATLQLLEAEAELERCNKEISEKESRLERVVQAATARLSKGRDELLSDISLLSPLFGNSFSLERNGQAVSDIPSPQLHKQNTKRITELFGEPLSELQFLKTRLVPTMREFGIEIPSKKVGDLHAIMVASNFVALPDVSWAVAYASALGGSAVSHCISVEPNWISFSQVFEGELGAAHSEALIDNTRLQIIVLEGIDRCPSHAWLQPWIQLNAGWRTNLPNCDANGWPSNLRFVLTEEKSAASFPVPKNLLRWVTPFATEPFGEQEAISKCIEGHLPFETWKLTTSLGEDFAFESLFRELSTEPLLLEAQLRRLLVRRLRDVYVRLGKDEDRVATAIRWLLRLNSADQERQV
jgi:hypothetical protein